MQRTAIGFFGLLVGLMLVGCAPQSVGQPLVVEFDFDNGALGWTVALADYPPDQEENLALDFGARELPEELNDAANGLFISSNNSPDDLFTFIKRRVGVDEDLSPNTAYTVRFEIQVASKAGSDCIGAGGAPGESVYLKVGGVTDEPIAALDETENYVRVNFDKGDQATGGSDASLAGDIANGSSEGCDDPANAPFIYIERSHTHTGTVTTDGDGNLWLVVGTDSGFESVTELYYRTITVTLTPGT